MDILAAILIGFILDLIFGDPHWLPHPVRLIGFLILKGEKLLRRLMPKSEFAGGVLLTIFVTGISFAVPLLILYVAGIWSIYAKIAIEAIFCYQILATKSLKTESMRVYKYLIKGDMANSRKYLSWIVGRDTDQLDESQIAKAAVETVAENTSDGVIAPMIFMILGGAPLGFFYKAVNTLDSMIGYKNEKYLYFGRFAAKLDDVLNFIPAIFSAYMMIFSSFIVGLNFKNAMKIYRRDKHNHSSPNSAKTEAVAAGALDLQLAGDAYYFGKLVKKQTIGDNNKEVRPQAIKIANRLMYATAITSMALLGGLRALSMLIF